MRKKMRGTSNYQHFNFFISGTITVGKKGFGFTDFREKVHSGKIPGTVWLRPTTGVQFVTILRGDIKRKDFNFLSKS